MPATRWQARNPGGKKTPQDIAHPTPDIYRLCRNMQVIGGSSYQEEPISIEADSRFLSLGHASG